MSLALVTLPQPATLSCCAWRWALAAAAHEFEVLRLIGIALLTAGVDPWRVVARRVALLEHLTTLALDVGNTGPKGPAN